MSRCTRKLKNDTELTHTWWNWKKHLGPLGRRGHHQVNHNIVCTLCLFTCQSKIAPLANLARTTTIVNPNICGYRPPPADILWVRQGQGNAYPVTEVRTRYDDSTCHPRIHVIRLIPCSIASKLATAISLIRTVLSMDKKLRYSTMN